MSTISTQASIWPEDAVLSETYVPKDVDHPGTPAQVSIVTHNVKQHLLVLSMSAYFVS